MTDALQRAIATLWIDGDDLDPEEITRLLGGNPRSDVRKGQTFLDQSDRLITARTGRWRFGGDWENEPNVGDQIAVLLAQLSQDLDVWTSITSRYHCYMCVGGYLRGWTGGITFEPHILTLLAERGLSIDFDLYAPDMSKDEHLP